jgi:8-oxo-dGTP pyrophosphatase MutT (NUDIX family)
MFHGASVLLTLPDGKVVFQRRTKDAPRAPGLLGLFGGEMEQGESHAATAKRELAEETSLPVDSLKLEYIGIVDVEIPEGGGQTVFRTYLYAAQIPIMEFEVFEGERAEAYTLKQLQSKRDLTRTAIQALSKVFGGTYGA